MATKTIAVATLSTQNWITDANAKFDTLMGHFISSDYNQSEIYQGNIANLQRIIEQNQQDPPTCAQAIQNTLSVYLGRYYPEGVRVSCSFQLLDEKESASKVKYTLIINFKEAGVEYNAQRVLDSIRGRFAIITEANNA